ncbi:hypothetical protein C8039_19980 [Halogeometricum sp. wsp3]|nr:hypothetical protein C8039_19980 [Halogeometricum sp. wsp3]
MMRYTDIQSVFPVFILLLLLVYLFGAELWMIIALYECIVSVGNFYTNSFMPQPCSNECTPER